MTAKFPQKGVTNSGGRGRSQHNHIESNPSHKLSPISMKCVWFVYHFDSGCFCLYMWLKYIRKLYLTRYSADKGALHTWISQAGR